MPDQTKGPNPPDANVAGQPAPPPLPLGKAQPNVAKPSASDPGLPPQFDDRLAVTKDNLGDVVRVDEVPGAMPGTQFRGYCRKCGWQTHQPTQQLAGDGVREHAAKHIIQAFARTPQPGVPSQPMTDASGVPPQPPAKPAPAQTPEQPKPAKPDASKVTVPKPQPQAQPTPITEPPNPKPDTPKVS